MPDKKPTAPEPSDDTELEKHVDAIMDVDKDETPEPETKLADLSGDDPETDKAIDDIVIKESDTVLAVEDNAKKPNRTVVVSDESWKAKLRRLGRNKRFWAVVIVLLVVIFAVPLSRYKVLGLVIKRPVTLVIVDSKTHTPISNAQISLGGVTAKTDANGKAHLSASLGKTRLIITKQYYLSINAYYFVGFKQAPVGNGKPISMGATGRLVPLTITNKITGQPLKGVEIRVLDTTAKTNAKGQASIALPATKPKDDAKLSLGGYNTAAVTIEVIDKVVKANSFALTPVGHIYFLSNSSGNIDVVKSDLDGSNRKVVLAGTGKEDQNTTSLLASRDWRYLVLKARRDTAEPAMYLIDANTDKVTQFDNGDANFNLVGWYGHAFVYDLTRNSLSNWQAGREALKSYDADNLQLNLLDQNQAEGDANNYAQQSFYNFYIVDGAIVYNTQWYTYASFGPVDSSGKTDTIRAIAPNGQNKKDYQSFPTGSTGYIQAALYEPQAIYYAVYSNTDSKTTYYAYEDQGVKTVNIDAGTFNKTYPTFLLSPSGKQTFWTELRDGKNSLFVGDVQASNKKQLASLSNYAPYGWYGDSYTLVSKDSSELYIMPAAGLKTGQNPLKITDYYKPAQTYNGYGYGYGGL